jgi:hypothetical protein
MITINAIRMALERLITAADAQAVRYPFDGICYNFTHLLWLDTPDPLPGDMENHEKQAREWLIEQFVSLGLNPAYPVEDPDFMRGPCDNEDDDINELAYCSAAEYGGLWTGPYGANRRQLLRTLYQIALTQTDADIPTV